MLDYLASTTEREAESAPLPLERGYRADIARRAHALRYDRDEAERRIEQGIRFDQTFPAFQVACERASVELLIVTSGIQELVERYLARRGVSAAVVGNEADMRSDGWRVRFRDDSLAGIDKAGFVERAHAEGRLAVVIGDDRSDFDAALAADDIYVKNNSELERFLAERGRSFRAFDRFSDILERWPPAFWSAEGRGPRD